jgi:hypothetical protein
LDAAILLARAGDDVGSELIAAIETNTHLDEKRAEADKFIARELGLRHVEYPYVERRRSSRAEYLKALKNK